MGLPLELGLRTPTFWRGPLIKEYLAFARLLELGLGTPNVAHSPLSWGLGPPPLRPIVFRSTSRKLPCGPSKLGEGFPSLPIQIAYVFCMICT